MFPSLYGTGKYKAEICHIWFSLMPSLTMLAWSSKWENTKKGKQFPWRIPTTMCISIAGWINSHAYFSWKRQSQWSRVSHPLNPRMGHLGGYNFKSLLLVDVGETGKGEGGILSMLGRIRAKLGLVMRVLLFSVGCYLPYTQWFKKEKELGILLTSEFVQMDKLKFLENT